MLRTLDQQKRISIANKEREYEEDVPSIEKVAEPTQPYNGKIKDDTVTIPSSVLRALQQQLENKDAQIATLLSVINNQK